MKRIPFVLGATALAWTLIAALVSALQIGPTEANAGKGPAVQ